MHANTLYYLKAVVSPLMKNGILKRYKMFVFKALRRFSIKHHLLYVNFPLHFKINVYFCQINFTK